MKEKFINLSNLIFILIKPQKIKKKKKWKKIFSKEEMINYDINLGSKIKQHQKNVKNFERSIFC